MVTDPVADMMIRLKNAQAAGRPTTLVPYSNFKWAIAELLKREGYVKTVNKKGKKVKRSIEVELVYTNGQPKISEVKRVSKPSRRLYHRASEVHAVRRGYGLAVYSTSRGVMTDKEARTAKQGGEILFKVW